MEVTPPDISTPRALFLATFLGIITFALGFNTTALFDMVPRISESLHLTSVSMQWLINSYMLTVTVLILAGGKLGDFFHKKKLLGVASVGFVLASVLIGVSFNVPLFFIGRILQGLFLAIILPVVIALLKVTIPEALQVAAFGIWSAILGLGFASGPTLGGVITLWFGWRAVFFTTGGMLLFGLLITWYLIPHFREPLRKFRFDWWGLLLFILSLGLIVLGVMQGQAWGWFNIATLLCIGVGLVLLALFFVVEHVVSEPLLPLDSLRNRLLISAVVGNVGYGFGMTVTLSYVLSYLQDPLLLNQNPLMAGVGLLPFSLAIFTVSLCMTWIYKLIPSVNALLRIAFLSLVISEVIMAFLRLDAGYGYFVAPLVFAGIGIALLQSNLPKRAADSVRQSRLGQAAGMTWTAFYIGAVLCIMVNGIVHHIVLNHVFVTRVMQEHFSRQFGDSFVHMLESGQHTLRFLINHLIPVSSNKIALAYQVAAVRAMDVVMLVSALFVGTVACITIWLARESKKPKESWDEPLSNNQS